MRRVHLRYPLLAVLALCLVGVVGGGDAATDATYVELRLLGEVLGIIADQYVDPVPFTKLVGDAIVGTLRAIDPDSGYLDRDALRELADASAPRSGDVGLEVTRRGDVFEVVTALRGTPAARADIRTGDRIVKIDAVDTSGLQRWQAPDAPDLGRDPQLRRALEVITAARILERGRAEEDCAVERDEPVTRP
jgi:carboxyl-terminal processing protease